MTGISIEALHTAARRYCIEQAKFWYERYASSRVDPDTEAARVLFPRYLVLQEILVEVERLPPHTFGSLDEAQEWLLLAGEAAQGRSTSGKPMAQGAAGAAIREERQRFGAFVHRFVAAEQWDVEPLPYRRTLSDAESCALWDRLKARWGVTGAWYPITGEPPPPNSITFRADAFDDTFGTERLQRLLLELGVKRAFALSEGAGSEPEQEIDIALLDPRYTGLEGYWSAPGLDWLIYASHENSLTVAGAELIAALKAAWPEWHRHLYKDWLEQMRIEGASSARRDRISDEGSR